MSFSVVMIRVRIAPFSCAKEVVSTRRSKARAHTVKTPELYSSVPFAAVLRIFCHGSEFKTPFRGGSCGMVRAARWPLSGLLSGSALFAPG
jgi:hypothetical protein